MSVRKRIRHITAVMAFGSVAVSSAAQAQSFGDTIQCVFSNYTESYGSYCEASYRNGLGAQSCPGDGWYTLTYPYTHGVDLLTFRLTTTGAPIENWPTSWDEPKLIYRPSSPWITSNGWVFPALGQNGGNYCLQGGTCLERAKGMIFVFGERNAASDFLANEPLTDHRILSNGFAGNAFAFQPGTMEAVVSFVEASGWTDFSMGRGLRNGGYLTGRSQDVRVMQARGSCKVVR